MKSVLNYFAGHRVAGNIVMFLTILAGVWGFQQLNFQLFPTFTFSAVSVTTDWDGAGPEDVHESVSVPLENALLALPVVRGTRATSTEGRSSIRVTLADGEDLASVEQTLQDALDSASLPDNAEAPRISQWQFSETVGSVLVYGDVPVAQLSALASDYANELRALGLSDVSVNGQVRETLEIVVSSQDLLTYGLTLESLAAQIRARNVNAPAGSLESDGQLLRLRADGQSRQLNELANLTLSLPGSSIRLGDLAQLRADVGRDTEIIYQGLPAVRIDISRKPDDNSLAVARTMTEWVASTGQQLPDGVALHTYRESWQTLQSRLTMVLGNGLIGMVLVLAVLFFFLNTRLAFWVAVGIPVSFLATFLFMGLSNISINIISMFGFMIALGIIVDDAIVVSEDAQAERDNGADSEAAVQTAIQRMVPPVLASSLTTLAAFLPLTLVGGRFGSLMADIPLVVAAAIVASLIECFIILPGHLRHSLSAQRRKGQSRFRYGVDQGFRYFRDRLFRPIVSQSIRHGLITVAAVSAAMMLTLALLQSGRVPWTPFPDIEGSELTVRVSFTPDSNPEILIGYLDQVEQALQDTAEALDYDFIDTSVVSISRNSLAGRIDVEIPRTPDRPYTTGELLQEWRSRMPNVPGLANLTFSRTWGGLGTADVTIQLTGTDLSAMQAASSEAQARLADFGITDIEDDLPTGPDQLSLRLSAQGESAGLTLIEVSQYLNNQLQGQTVQTFIANGEEIPLRLRLPEIETRDLRSWESLPFPLASGQWTPLGSLLNTDYRTGLERVQSTDGRMDIQVTGQFPPDADRGLMLSQIENELIPALRADTGIAMALAGEREEEAETARTLIVAMIVALTLMYLILAWIFSAWTWPLIVLVTIPFGLAGALFGHWVLNLPLSFLSLFGLFGLSGIVVNDSIVLLTFFRRLREDGVELFEAAVEATCQRLRAVLLTSVTTIAGLTPILLNTSLDAQFLRPMAAGLVFGLVFSTLLILLLVPTLLVGLEKLNRWWNRAAEPDSAM